MVPQRGRQWWPGGSITGGLRGSRCPPITFPFPAVMVTVGAPRRRGARGDPLGTCPLAAPPSPKWFSGPFPLCIPCSGEGS